ncbi:hypothetical protein MLD38_007743 [Melastoma candidum]|uniref:Uncharacterized protein n=1 Tax=Melastoma candidum TaxID=119954 RepID=A0ACB9RRJ0_9MYRT|nr:hypothetical protein MLD38_007743 [Melastoma candidum]
MPNQFLLLLLLLPSLQLRSASAQPSPTTLPAPAQDFLDAHNRARSAVNVPQLQWSSYLANLTSLLVRRQRDTAGCQFANLTSSKYGGNQLLAGGSIEALPKPRAAVEEWVKEKAYYDYGNNTCVPGHETCGVYTQVVWGKSRALGCGQAVCGKEALGLTVCFYDPPGNVVGERPY